MGTRVEDPSDTLWPVIGQIWTAHTIDCSWRMEMPWTVNSGEATSLMAWTQYEALQKAKPHIYLFPTLTRVVPYGSHHGIPLIGQTRISLGN